MSEKKDKDNINFFKRIPFFQKRDSYLPWYSDYSDYNTNAKSYYDYLAKFNKLIRYLVDFINRALNRNIKFNKTKSIDFTKKGDWIDNGKCEPNHFDDIINVSADVILSKEIIQFHFENLKGKTFPVSNGTLINDDGVWSPNYINVLHGIDDDIGNINKDIKNIKNDISNLYNEIEEIKNIINNNKGEQDKIKNALQKIVNNLYNSGAINNNNIFEYQFNANRNIANGNINIFGGTADGTSFIRTNNTKSENDISAGI